MQNKLKAIICEGRETLPVSMIKTPTPSPTHLRKAYCCSLKGNSSTEGPSNAKVNTDIKHQRQFLMCQEAEKNGS